jgi:hypothetical protein
MIDSKEHDFGCFGLAKTEMARLKKKSGSKLPHSRCRFIREVVYHRSNKSQGKLEGKNAT